MTARSDARNQTLEIVKLLIPGVLALVASILTFMTLQQSKVNAVKTEEVKAEAGKIHTLVNSNLTGVKNELAESKRELATLRTLVEKIALKSPVTAEQAKEAKVLTEPERSPK